MREFKPGGTSRDTWDTTSSQQTAMQAGLNDYVTLVRGCNSPDQLNNIVTMRLPTVPRRVILMQQLHRRLALTQVAFEGVPWKVTGTQQAARLQLGVPEWTTNERIACSFGMARGGVVQARILKRYLTQGSGSEGGWLAANDAPIDGRWYVLPPQKK